METAAIYSCCQGQASMVHKTDYQILHILYNAGHRVQLESGDIYQINPEGSGLSGQRRHEAPIIIAKTI